jgi:hypothetical protein
MVTDVAGRPAFYSVGAGTGGIRDWVTLLHPPYTAWHLSYVAIGATLAPTFTLWRLGGTLLAFFLAVGIGAHALDELSGRPLRTGITRPFLWAAAVVSVAVPVVVGLAYGGLRLLPFVVVGAVLVAGYNLELWGLHNAMVFGLGWGAFPVLTGFYAQDFTVGLSAVIAAVAAFLLSLGQRALSAPARSLRRRAATVHGRIEMYDGTVVLIDRATMLTPIETALRFVAAGLSCVAVATVVARL